MKVLLLGKIGSIIRWVEDMASDLRIAGHTVTVHPTRNPLFGKSVERLLLSPAIGAPLATHAVRRMRRSAPDLMIVVGAFDHAPAVVLEALAQAPARPPLIAWIGDAFGQEMAAAANLFDVIAYTDSALLERHRQFGFRSACAFVPLGATRAIRTTARVEQRSEMLAFVAAPVPNRRALLSAVRDPVAIFGPGWNAKDSLAHHAIDARRINARELAAIYASYTGVLNIRNDLHVINGLNQRHFAPYLQGTPVITDTQPDVAYCFEPGSEILVYQDVVELNDVYARLQRDPVRAGAVGELGKRRVLAHHTYAHRLEAIARIVL